MRPENVRRNETFLILILVAVCLTLFFFQIGARPIWDIDEGAHASTSRDMVLSGDWITPTFNGQPFYDKPILHNWLVAFSFLAFGFTEFAARLPSAVLASACVMITYLMGKKMFGPVIGFLGGVILATAVEFVILARTVVHDISLVFFVTLALYLFYLVYADVRQKIRNLVFFYAALGLAVLSKGPVGLALPAMTIGLYLVFKKNLAFIKQMQIGWGLLIFLAVASPWYILISLKNPDYAGYFFIKQNLGSFLSSDPRHPEPFYYYIPVLFGGFFPWSCFLPLALIYAVRKRFHNVSQGTALLGIWFAVVFIFFSMAGSKLPTYILPLFPAASLLVALLWKKMLDASGPQIRKGFILSLLPVVLVFLAALIYLRVYPPVEVEYESGVKIGQINFMVAWFVLCMVISFIFLLIRKTKAFFTSLVAMVMSALLIFLILIVPSINPYRSTKQLAEKFDRLIAEKEDLVFYSRIKESALFYTHRKARVLEHPDDLKDYLASDKKVYCIITRKKLARLPLMPYVVARQGDKLLISNNKSP
jgi:4-amino-4-deoxy-L-arabinose transferase-like glycosyltransferase